MTADEFNSLFSVGEQIEFSTSGGSAGSLCKDRLQGVTHCKAWSLESGRGMVLVGDRQGVEIVGISVNNVSKMMGAAMTADEFNAKYPQGTEMVFSPAPEWGRGCSLVKITGRACKASSGKGYATIRATEGIYRIRDLYPIENRAQRK